MHLSANVSDAAPKALREELHGRVTAVFTAPDMETARALLAKILTDYEADAPSAVAILERGFDDASTVGDVVDTLHSPIYVHLLHRIQT
jgi:hypothetical protein